MILNKKRNLSINLSKKAAVFVLLICCVFTALAATTRLLPLALAQQTEEEKLIAQIEETLQWYPMDEKLSPEQRTAAYRENSEKGLALCQQFLEKYPQHEDAVKVKLDQLSFLTRLRRYDEAEQLAREFLAKHPTDPYADGFRWTLVSNYKSKGEYDAALAELELIKEPEWVVHWERNQIYQLKNLRLDAERIKEILEKSKLDAERIKYEYQLLEPSLKKYQMPEILEKSKLDAERIKEEYQLLEPSLKKYQMPEIFEKSKLDAERIKEEYQLLEPSLKKYQMPEILEKSKLDAERRKEEIQPILENIKLDTERRKEEIQQILKTIELDKETNLAWMRYWRGVAYGEVGEYQKAIADISNAIAAHGHPAFYFSRGVVYAKIGEEEKATADLCAFIDRMLLNEKPGLMIRTLAYAGVISGNSQQICAQLNEIFKALTGQDIDYDAKAVDAKEWKKAFDAWRIWWQANRESFRPATSAVTLSPGGFGF